jgi:hypothetical protein
MPTCSMSSHMVFPYVVVLSANIAISWRLGIFVSVSEQWGASSANGGSTILLSFAHQDHPLVPSRSHQRCILSDMGPGLLLMSAYGFTMYCYNVSRASMFQPDSSCDSAEIQFLTTSLCSFWRVHGSHIRIFFLTSFESLQFTHIYIYIYIYI